jgi:putative acetyltransferase
MANEITLRKATPADLPQMKELYRGTIMEVCAGEYDEAQRKVWSASADKADRWADMVRGQYVLLAITEGQIAGFASLDKGDYLDFMYVHKDFQRRGIADLLLTAMENEAMKQGASGITSDISMTARPFFEKRRYIVLREQENERLGVVLLNYKMHKQLQ